MQTVKLHPRLHLVHTLLEDGNIDARYGTTESVRQNRKNIFKELKIQPYQIIEAAQVHSDRILKLDPENTKMWRGHNVTGVDAFVTDQTDVYLMLRLADCVPLALYDVAHHAAALVHAGWRGTVKHIHLKALDRLVQEYGTLPSQVLAWFGPAACATCFISPQEPQQRTQAEWKPFIKKRASGWAVDLVGYQQATLKQHGLLKKHMSVSPDCTVESPHLFSHLQAQRDQVPEGRFAVLLRLLP